MEEINIKLFSIDEQELLQIWDNFSDLMIEDKEECSRDILDFLENTMIEIATGKEIILHTNKSIAYLLEVFLKHFYSDKKNYKFIFQNIVATGKVLDN